jgi:hypothetical protein
MEEHPAPENERKGLYKPLTYNLAILTGYALIIVFFSTVKIISHNEGSSWYFTLVLFQTGINFVLFLCYLFIWPAKGGIFFLSAIMVLIIGISTCAMAGFGIG